MQSPPIDRLETPCLLVDEARMTRNVERLKSRLDRLGPTLRPHLKTCKSVDIARRLNAGAVESAAGGVLFFDAINELKPELQPKLLRLLDAKEYHRIGEGQARKLSARVLAGCRCAHRRSGRLKETDRTRG